MNCQLQPNTSTILYPIYILDVVVLQYGMLLLFMFCLCFVIDRGPFQQPTGRSQQTAEVMPTPVSAVTSLTHVSESLPSGQLQPPHIGRCVEVHVHTYMMTTLKGYVHREWIICMG